MLDCSPVLSLYIILSAVCCLHYQNDINIGNNVEQTPDSVRIRSEYHSPLDSSMWIGAGTARQFECIVATSPFLNDNLIRNV